MTNIQTWPLNIDFTIAVQNPQLCFADPDLKASQTSKNSRGRVLLWSGNFATVYKLIQGDRAWAVRCFTRIPQADVQKRYQLISDYLSQHPIPYLVDFEFLAQGILVKGEWYPILKMDWVNGTELDRYIGEYIDDSQVLLRLERQLQQLKTDLQRAGIAHGDLQHGNIMVDDEGELKLVDYDGMYVPALHGSPPLEVGHPNYQPPHRSLDDFGDHLDDFSFTVISLSLRALANQPDLWQSFHEDNKNLIFRQNDFQEPESSPVFQSIANIPDDQTRELCGQLMRQCQPPEITTSPSAKQPTIPQLAKLPNYSKPLVAIAIVILGFAIVSRDRFITPPQVAKTPPPPQLTQPPTPPSPTITTAPRATLTTLSVTDLLARYNNGQRDFRNVQITGTEGESLQGKDLSNINLSGAAIEKLDLRQIVLKNANLTGIKILRADLRGADLSKANLIDANLTASSLAQSNLTEANLLRINLSQTKLDGANLQRTELTRSNLAEADLSNTNLTGANLTLANLYKANLTRANLSVAILAAANLKEALLDEADLTAADLRSANLELTNLTNANLSRGNLINTRLAFNEFTGTNFSGANFRQAKIENIGSIESADFSDVLNLATNTRKYLCSLASGNVPAIGISTKATLNCGTLD